jgi:hypothetical protein
MPGARCCRAIIRPHIPLHNSRDISARQMALWFCGEGRRHGRAMRCMHDDEYDDSDVVVVAALEVCREIKER